MLYLVVKCAELGDQWECDADRVPLCLTEDVSQYGLGYEIYRVNPDNTFTLVKEYKKGLESGMALCQWIRGEGEPTIIEKWKDKERDGVTRSLVKDIKRKAGFRASTKVIIGDIRSHGSYGEIVQGNWVVFGEYTDNKYPLQG